MTTTSSKLRGLLEVVAHAAAMESKRERPILFSGPMVRAILDGRKTQTRRVLRNWWGHDDTRPEVGVFHPTVIRRGEEEPGDPIFGAFSPDGEWAVKSPYGGPGDRLWVRETWSFIGQQGVWDLGDAQPHNCKPIYRADSAEADRWWPSIHMPRWASRLTLEITEVRVERLQDISENDAKAEGVLALADQFSTAQATFRVLWDSLNGPRDYGWDVNPWVWVISFRTLSEREAQR